MRTSVTAFVVLVSIAGTGWSQPKTHASATFITGGPTGTWYMTGAAIAELVNKHYEGQPISVTPGKGAIANPLSVGAGKAELGLSYAPYLKLAFEGRNEVFTRRGFPNLRAIAAVVPDTVHIVMAADVAPDVFSRLASGATIRIGVGQKGSSNHFVLEKILEAYGYDYDGLRAQGSTVVEGAQQGLVDAYQNRQIDIYSNTVGINAGSVRHPVSSRRSRLFSVPDAIRDSLVDEWGYVKSTIPAGTYPGQDGPVETLDLGTIVFTNAAMDDEIVYLIAKSLAENRDRLIAGSAGFIRWQPEDMPVGLPIEVHPGALKYYRERGWVQ
jgi:TRAP transporter TAXI family solute receptor